MYIVNGVYHSTKQEAIEDAQWLIDLLADDDKQYSVAVTDEQYNVIAIVSVHGVSMHTPTGKIDFKWSE